ncbi:MAG: PQQ-binding-like beta-propeller repeat protein [candidate division WOR-3 bacterium]
MMSFFILMGVSAVIPQGWPMFRYDQARTGFCPAVSDFSAKPRSKVEWMVWDEGDLILASPVGADFNDDGWHDVVTSSYTAGFFYPLVDVYRGDNGLRIWSSGRFASEGCYRSSPALMDVNGDNKPEVFVSHTGAGALYALNGKDGSTLWTVSIGTSQFPSPLVMDDKPDGRVCACNDAGVLYCLNATTGAVIWAHGASAGGTCYSSPSAGDVNSDGQDEIVYSCGTNLYVVSESGVELWNVSVGEDYLSTVALSDKDGDGDLEMWVYCGKSGFLKVYEYGNPSPVISTFVGSIYGLGGLDWPPPPAVADVNNDGTPDAVLHHFNGVIMVNGASGSVVWNTPAQDLYGPVIMANLDLDPYLEIVVTGMPPDWGTRCKVEMYQENGSLAWQWWSEENADYHDEVEGEAILINVDADPEYEIAAVDYSCWAVVLDNSPLQTEEDAHERQVIFTTRGHDLYLCLPKEARVSLSVYDGSGRLTENLYDGVLSAGDHAFSLNTETKGVYLAVLRFEGQTKTLKVIR